MSGDNRFGFLFQFGVGPYRAYVYPMRGQDGPYRMVITAETGAESTYYGLPTAERCVESAATFLRCQGVKLPPGMAEDWRAAAAAIDNPPKAPEPLGGWQ